MIVVLTLGGMNFGLADKMRRALGGYATAEGRTRVPVKYPQAASARSITEGAAKLDAAIRYWIERGNTVEVLAFSQGAEACSEWMADHADKPDAPDPSELSFILLGNPRRRLGGAGKIGWNWKRLPRTPETQYRTNDISRLNDPWSNGDRWGTTPRSKLSMTLARFLGWDSDHGNYDNVNIDDCQIREVSRRTTYLVAP
ncbi:MAG: PE-PPE domain-containing protein [Mycobacterium sp.]